MGYDMQISSLHKRSVEIIARTVNMEVEDMINSSIDKCYPLMITENGYKSIYELSNIESMTISSIVSEIENGISICLSEILDIAYCNCNVLSDFWKTVGRDKPFNGQYIVLNKRMYNSILKYMENYLKSSNLFDVYIRRDNNLGLADGMISLYTQMYECYTKINWEEYLVYFESDW